MMSINCILVTISLIIVASLIAVIVFFKRRYSHWKNLGLEYAEPSIPFGNLRDISKKQLSIGEWFAEFYTNIKAKNLKHAGCYILHKPVYVPVDLDLIKRILQTDFVHFTDRGRYVNEKSDPLSASVFALNGQKWKNLRAKLTPTFTSRKMKLMFPIMVTISHELIDALEEECQNSPMDAKDVSARFTTDIIGNCAFGIDCNSLKDPNTEFRIQGRRIFNFTPLEMIKNFLTFAFPDMMRFFGARFFPKDPADFFFNVIKDTADYRNKNGIRRNDAFQLLLDMLRQEGKEGDVALSFNELAAQAFVFFAAGFETSSSLMSFALLELSLNEHVQNRLRKEINDVLGKNSGEVTYEKLSEMCYLDMVINETLRKYPPIPILLRKCTKDYLVPESNIKIFEGDAVMIPMQGIHYDPEYYPDPQKFDPERFSEGNKRRRHQFAFLPFGEGPRICLGIRFGLMQAKVGLVSLVKNFKFKVNPITKLPLKLDPKGFLTSALGGLWIDTEKVY